MLSLFKPYSVNDRMINEYKTDGGIRNGRRNLGTRKEPASVSLCPQKLHI
jgi:hypothetical protein